MRCGRLAEEDAALWRAKESYGGNLGHSPYVESHWVRCVRGGYSLSISSAPCPRYVHKQGCFSLRDE